MTKRKSMRGAGSGGGAKSPTRTDDNLFSRDTVEIVLGLSEGPIKGFATTPDGRSGMQQFYVGGTPLMSQNGGINFESFNLGVKTGTPFDSPVNYVLEGEASNKQIGTQLFQGVWVTRTTDVSLRNVIDQLQVRIAFNVLYTQNNDGSFDNTASFQIQYRQSAGGGWAVAVADPIQVTGKTSSGGYVVDYAWDVPRINGDWDIRVLKQNPDNDSTNFCDLSWESYQSITKSNRVYTNLALVHIVALATSQFSSIPDFAGIYDGLMIKTPNNYNASGDGFDESGGYWNGAFKDQLEWTNNPALILYDMITNTRYGLAKYYPHITANRFDFYEAAKWCATKVPNGKGGTQSRYTFNMVIQDQKNGLDMLAFVAGSFGATLFDDATGAVYLRVDRWTEPTLLFTPENITADGFSYSFTDMTTRYNDLTVKFTNPDLDWNDDVRPVRNDDHINRNGSIPFDFDAVGCTDEHEALRRGYYRMITATTEVAQVSFTTTRLGQLADPWSVIAIADPTPGWSMSGRIKSYSNGTIYLRDPIFFTVNQVYNLRIQAVSGLYTVQVAADITTATAVYQLRVVGGAVPGDLPDRTVFTIEDNGNFGVAKPFRVINIDAVDGSPDQYTITGIEVNINKQAAADNCQAIGSVPYSFKNPLIPAPPTNLKLESGTAELVIGQDGSIAARIYAGWDTPPGVIDHYDISWKESRRSDWLDLTSTGESVFLGPCVTGTAYDLVIWSVSTFGYRSAPLAVYNYVVVGKDEPPSQVQNFSVIVRDDDMLLKWDPIVDLDRYGYEIRLGDSWETAALIVTDYSATQFAYKATASGSYKFLIKAIDTSHNYSLLPTLQAVFLGGPSSVKGVIAIQSQNRIEMRWDPNPENNILEYEIREGMTWATAVFVAKVKSTSYSMVAGSAGTRVFWLKAIGSPGIYSDKATFVTTDIAKSDNTNLIYTTDESVNLWTGTRYNMIAYGDSLRMSDEKQVAEYLFTVQLTTQFRAQNTMFITLDAITDFGYTWQEATFPWTDVRAQREWAAEGDISSINYQAELAIQEATTPDILYAWKMDNNLVNAADLDDGQATEILNVSYKAGKYGAGVYVDNHARPQPTQVTYSVNIPGVFSTMFWIVPDHPVNDANPDSTDTYVNLVGRNGQFTKIFWDPFALAITCTDHLGNILIVPINLISGDRYAVMLVQELTKRTLYVGREDGSYAYDTAPIPAITNSNTINVKLY